MPSVSFIQLTLDGLFQDFLNGFQCLWISRLGEHELPFNLLITAHSCQNNNKKKTCELNCHAVSP